MKGKIKEKESSPFLVSYIIDDQFSFLNEYTYQNRILYFNYLVFMVLLLYGRLPTVLHLWFDYRKQPSVPISQLSFLGPHLVAADHYIPGTPQKTCCFESALTQSSGHRNLEVVKVTQIVMLAHFPAIYRSTSITNCFIAAIVMK